MKGKIIALDFGLKRTGIAVTDDLCLIASPHETVDSQLLESHLQKLVSMGKTSAIVIGEPKQLDGSDSHVSQNVRLLQEVLKKRFPDLDIVLHDERFTSVMASRAIASSGLNKSKRGQKALIDKVSAAILLQSYLDYLLRTKKS